MITVIGFSGNWFKNTKDNRVVCSCCGKKIIKGYIVSGMNLGENCYESIRTILTQKVKEDDSRIAIFSLLPMHFEWIKRA